MMIENQTFADQLPVVQSALDGETIPTINARYLHTALGVGRDLSTWIRDRIDKFRFREGVDFIAIRIFPESGEKSERGRPAIEYHLSLRMAAHISMVQNNPQGQRCRDYFYDFERRHVASLKSGGEVTVAQLARAMVDMQENQQLLQSQLHALRLTVDDPQRQLISDGGLIPIWDVIKNSAVKHRRRNALVRRIGNAVALRCQEAGIAVHRQVGRDHVRLFPRHVVDQFMRDVGDTWVSEYNAAVKGQGVLPFSWPRPVK